MFRTWTHFLCTIAVLGLAWAPLLFGVYVAGHGVSPGTAVHSLLTALQ